MPIKRKILLLGKLPPPFMGPSVAFKILTESKLKDIYDLSYLDIKANESLHSLGKWSVRKLFINAAKYRQLSAILSGSKPELTLIPVSQSGIGFVKDSIYILICSFHNSKVLIQLRGGNFRNWFESSSFIMKAYVKFVLRKTEGVIVQGNCLKKIFDGFYPPDNIFVVPNGGDFSFERKSTRQQGPVRITYLGNLQPSKGIEDVIEAIRMLHQTMPGTFVLDVMGAWRNSETQARCVSMVEENNLPVTFLNGKTGSEKFDLLLSSDLFVFTPREPEGHPWVIIEAMAAGLPVIATDQGAITESVIDQENGFIVPAQNPAAIAQKLTILLKDSELREQMGRKSREHYLSKFTEAHMVENYSRTFDEVIGRHRF